MMLPDDVFNRRLNQAAKAAAIAITNSSHSKVLAHYSWDTLPENSKRFLHSVIVGSVRERLRMPYKPRDDDELQPTGPYCMECSARIEGKPIVVDGIKYCKECGGPS